MHSALVRCVNLLYYPLEGVLVDVFLYALIHILQVAQVQVAFAIPVVLFEDARYLLLCLVLGWLGSHCPHEILETDAPSLAFIKLC